MPPSPAAGRKLAGLEHAMRFTDDVAPFNVVLVLKVEGDLQPSALRAALDRAQIRHPLLQARIVPESGGYFFRPGAGPIPLEVCAGAMGDEWTGAAEAELHRRLDLAAGPLGRCRYLAGGDGGHIILTLHHTIVDAVSALHLVGELLSLAASRNGVDGREVLEEGRLPASALFPGRYTGAGFARAAAGFMARQMADEMKFRWHSRGVRKPPIAESGRCRILPVRFPAPLTAALLDAGRRRRITMNSLLGAGLMAAVQRRLYPGARAPLRHIVFSDMRPHLRVTVPAGVLGCCLSMFRFTVMVERDGGIWPLAQAIQESTLRAARAGERFLSYSMSPGMMKTILGMKAFRMAATALSYTGPLDLPDSYGPFSITALHAFTTNITLGPESSALVRLFRGELWWDFLYLDSDMDRPLAQEIACDIRKILEGAR